jgi:hypothetical protein
MKWWRTEHIPGVIIGGLAVALLGRPRVTRDIDALILIDDTRWKSFLDSGRSFGFVPRITDAIPFARDSRVLLLRHKRSSIDVDLSLGRLEFEHETVARAKRRRIAGVWIPLPTPEDLIVLKAIAHRSRDMSDIEGLVAVHSRLDSKRILRWVGEFAAILEMPELYDDLRPLLPPNTGSTR